MYKIDSALKVKLSVMPKTEIHVHLEGAMPPEVIWEMANRNNIQLPAFSLEDWREYYEFSDFSHFISVYKTCASCIRTASDFQFMVEEFHRYQATQNIVYTEAFISATHVVGKIPTNEFLNCLEAGCEIGEKKYNVRVRFIPDIARHYPDTQDKVLELATRGFERGLFLGLGLGGLETGFPPNLFKSTFKLAKDRGLRIVAHAGEVCGPESILDALTSLKVERIGHGIQSIKDQELIKRLKDERIPLEVCPGSNYRTKAVNEGEPHPIHRMLDEGLFCTLNSDDPPMFSTSLTEEYISLANQGLSWQDLWQLNLNTLEATFLTQNGKNLIKGKMNDFLVI